MAVPITGQQKNRKPKHPVALEANLPLFNSEDPATAPELLDATSYLNEDSESGKKSGSVLLVANLVDGKINTQHPVSMFMAAGNEPEDEWVLLAKSSDVLTPVYRK